MMKHLRLRITLLAIAISLAACSQADASTQAPEATLKPAPSTSEYFPLKQASYWVYQGAVKWTEPNSPETQETEITWKMEVVQVIQRDAITGYILHGGPWDLIWYEEGKAPSDYGIIQIGERFYQTPLETIWRLQDENDPLTDLVNDYQLLLDAPLLAGKKFCDAASMVRDDGMYCWVVGQENKISPIGILGIGTTEMLTEFPIRYQTLPDYTEVHFIPGIGISRYVYLHHGTASEVDVRLVEYHAGE